MSKVGECLPSSAHVVGVREASPPPGAVQRPHRYEVYAVTQLDLGGAWPGESTVDEAANEACQDALASGAGIDRNDPPAGFKILRIQPSENSWTATPRSNRRVPAAPAGDHRGRVIRPGALPPETTTTITARPGCHRRLACAAMKIGLSLPTMLPGMDRDTVLTWCRRIEDDGYSTIGFGERIAYRNLEMFSVLSAAAAVTERVTIASTIVILPMHSATWVAKQTATLDVLSGGRVTLGCRRRRPRRGLPSPRPRPGRRFSTARPAGRGHPQPVVGRAARPRGSTRSARGPCIRSRSCPARSDRSRSAGRRSGPTASPGSRWIRRATRSPRPRDRVDAAWEAAGRDDRALPHDELLVRARRRRARSPARLRPRTTSACSGPSSPTRSPRAAPPTRPTPCAARSTISADLGYDEVQLVPTTGDIAELDRLTALVRAR